MPLLPSIILAIILCIAIGSIIELFIYNPLRRRNTSPMTLLIASLGVYIVLQNIISMIFGDNARSIRFGAVQEAFNILESRITQIQVIIIALSIITGFVILLFLKNSNSGKAMRAVASNKDLLHTIGLNSNRVILCAFAIGSAMAGFAGILISLDVDMTPTMGFHLLLMGVIAVIIGGVGSIRGIAMGALLLGFSQNIAAWYLPSQWQDAIAFVIMLIFLLFRPQGFFGKPLKKVEI